MSMEDAGRDTCTPCDSPSRCSTISSWGAHFKKEVDELVQIQRRRMKIIKYLENMAYEGRLKGLELFRLQ